MKHFALNSNHRAAWITWEIQPRNRSMAHSLGIPLYELVINKSRFKKYPVLLWKTLLILSRGSFDTVFVQNPSIVLSLLAVIYSKFSKTRIIVDAHNAGINPLEGRNKILNGVAKFIAQQATAVIVSNIHLAKIVDNWGGKSLVMPDPLPVIEEFNTQVRSTNPYIYFICTWADDEPYDEVIESAKLIPNNLDIYITGNYKKRLSDEDRMRIPGNVKLLGFLAEADYLAYFQHAVAAMDLTTRDHCLVCGAYESLAIEKPCIISDSLINREFFSKGFIYTKNDSQSIANAIVYISENNSQLQRNIIEQKATHLQNTTDNITVLKNRVFNHEPRKTVGRKNKYSAQAEMTD